MKIEHISIYKLYSAYSYDIDFSLEGNVTMITGPNGYGKTTILNIINSVANARWIYFYLLDFESIEIRFDNKDILQITKVSIDVEKLDEDTSDIINKNTCFKYIVSAVKESATLVLSYQLLLSETINHPYLIDDEDRYFRRNRVTPIVRIEKTVDAHPEIYQSILKKQGQEQFSIFFKRLNCRFIPAERIIMNLSGNHINSVEEVLDSLRHHLQMDYRNYLEEAQRLDSLMIDLILSSNIKPYNQEEYDKRISELQQKIDSISRYGFGKDLVIRPFDEEKAELLTVYVDTLEKKISRISGFVRKLNAFMDCIDRKGFAHKKVNINPNKGLWFSSSENGTVISPNKLSSGEKNEIILLYNLIFAVKNNSLLLVDEPENSLHVAWQTEFVDDIEDIAKANGIQAIIATHSPTIIGERWNKTYDLFHNNMES